MDKIWKSICDFVSSCFTSGTAAVGTALTSICVLFGGFDMPLQILLTFCVCDIIAAVCLAIFFKRSPKTEQGGLSSTVFREGVARKFGMFMIVVVAHYIDEITGINFLRSFVVSTFIVSEAISIIETIGLMGVPIPAVLRETIEILKKKNDSKVEENKIHDQNDQNQKEDSEHDN